MLCYLLTYWLSKLYYSYEHDLRDRNAPSVTVRWRSGDDATAARRAWMPHIIRRRHCLWSQILLEDYLAVAHGWPRARSCNNDMLPPNRKCEELSHYCGDSPCGDSPHMATPPVGGLRQFSRRTLATKLHPWLWVHSNAIVAAAHWCSCSLMQLLIDTAAHWCSCHWCSCSLMQLLPHAVWQWEINYSNIYALFQFMLISFFHFHFCHMCYTIANYMHRLNQ